MRTRSIRRDFRFAAMAVSLAQLLPSVGVGATVAQDGGADNVILTWNATALQGVRDAGGQNGPAKLGPPMVARALAIVHTCIYDAWAAYDPIAVGTRLGGTLRRPPSEQTLANKAEAISFAAYRALVDVMPVDTSIYQQVMTALGYDHTSTTTDTSQPAGVGNVACGAVLAFRHHDGANQLGDLHAGAYSDYTGYVPVNDPMVVSAPLDPATVHDPNRWQPLTYTDANVNVVTPRFVGPYWNHVTPFALTSDAQFRSATGPAKYGSVEYVSQALAQLAISATLDDRQKVIAEYFADGPSSELPPGHWNLFAQSVSRRDLHTLDQDAQMFFALTNAIFDAGIVAWDDKDHYDSVRPITAIRYLFRGVKVLAWGGPGRGTQIIDGGSWLPYQPSYFPTPPFPEYASGHSAFSAAGAEILKLFTSSDTFGDSVTIRAGSSQVEPGITPAEDVTLSWPTFTEAANEAGMSRRYGGIHFEQGDLDARAVGRSVAGQAWTKSLAFFAGTA